MEKHRFNSSTAAPGIILSLLTPISPSFSRLAAQGCACPVFLLIFFRCLQGFWPLKCLCCRVKPQSSTGCGAPACNHIYRLSMTDPCESFRQMAFGPASWHYSLSEIEIEGFTTRRNVFRGHLILHPRQPLLPHAGLLIHCQLVKYAACGGDTCPHLFAFSSPRRACKAAS